MSIADRINEEIEEIDAQWEMGQISSQERDNLILEIERDGCFAAEEEADRARENELNQQGFGVVEF